MSNYCTNEQVARYWVNGKDAKSCNGNMSAYASRGFLYSYNTVIGVRLKDSSGALWFIVSSGYYSATTNNKHYTARNKAISRDNIISLPYIDNIAFSVATHSSFNGLKDLMSEHLADLQARAFKPRIRANTKAQALLLHNSALYQFNRFLTAFKCEPLSNKGLI